MCAGMNQTLNCSASGLSYPEVMISGKHLSPLLTNFSTITLSAVVQNDTGSYTCDATNRHKTVSEMCSVDIGGIG